MSHWKIETEFLALAYYLILRQLPKDIQGTLSTSMRCVHLQQEGCGAAAGQQELWAQISLQLTVLGYVSSSF